MAVQADVERIASALRWLRGCLDDLEEMIPEWDKLPEGEKASFMGDWGKAMTSDVRVLVRAETAGWLTAAQKSEFVSLMDRVEHHRDDLDRLGLTSPITWTWTAAAR